MTATTVKSTRLTNRIAGLKSPARLTQGKLHSAQDTHTFATTSIDEVADTVLLEIVVPSNAIHQGCYVYNADLDTNGTPTLVIDLGLYAAEDFSYYLSSTKYSKAQFAVLDADALVDGSTALQAATTNWTALAPPSATFAPADVGQAYWEILGYDKDPNTCFIVGITNTAVSATPAAVAAAIRVDYYLD